MVLSPRNVAFILPAKKITSQDDAEFVDSILDRADNMILNFEEEIFSSIRMLVGDATVIYGVYWVTYEEDWVEGKDNLIGFARVVEQAIERNPEFEHLDILKKIVSLAKEAAERDLPLIIES
ncbi:hypothetical protein [Maricaulis sp. MIT060901]|uniref:hypothetical protein n=1 Tax=Maricaulis sp. MIT060901 TaxID=3096993 RepID=UPI00399C19CE